MTTIKHVEAKKGSGRSGGSHARSLMNYFQEGDAENRVLLSNFRNLPLSQTWGEATFEMAAIADSNPRSKNPMYHTVISWAEGEEPTPDQVEDAVDIISEELGAKGLACAYALHGDTKARHLHVVYCRNDLETGQVRKFNRGFDRVALHKASARLDAKYGWQRPGNALFRVEEGGDVVRSLGEGDTPKVPAKVRDMEVRTGTKSAVRTAQEQATDILLAATSWQQLHADLAAIGVRYERKGSGALLWLGGQPVKASSVSRKAALGEMQKRLGDYQPAAELPDQDAPEVRKPVAPRSEPVNEVAGALGWNTYRAEREVFFAEKRRSSEEFSRRVSAERRVLFATQIEDRREVLRHDWRGRGAQLNALKQGLGERHAKQKAKLIAGQKRQVAERRAGRFPSFEEWVDQKHGRAAATLYRHPSRLIFASGPQEEPGPTGDIRDYSAARFGDAVRYFDLDGRTAFIDQGPRIVLLDDSPEALLAFLQLSAQRYGAQMLLVGPDAFFDRAIEVAVRERITIANPELQERIGAERQRQDADHAERLAARAGQGAVSGRSKAGLRHQ